MSLSSRRAWIEIKIYLSRAKISEIVALLTESVDWNFFAMWCIVAIIKSLSSRRAWIEIWQHQKRRECDYSRSPHGERGLKCKMFTWMIVKHLCRSPHGERGLKYDNGITFWVNGAGRSPHGERGLKLKIYCQRYQASFVALLTESVDWNKICID